MQTILRLTILLIFAYSLHAQEDPLPTHYDPQLRASSTDQDYWIEMHGSEPYSSTTPSSVEIPSGTGEAPATGREEMVQVYFPNSPLAAILDQYERFVGKRLIKDANLTSPNLSLVVPNRIPKSEAVRLIETLLTLNQIILVPTDDGRAIKVLNVASGKPPRSQGLPLYTSETSLPKTDAVVSFFMPLKYISPTEAQQTFTQYVQQMNPWGSIVAVTNAQAIVITENTAAIRRFLALKELIDVPPAKVVNEFVQLERADAEKVVEIINKILDSGKKEGASTTPTPFQPQFPGMMPNQPGGMMPMPASFDPSASFGGMTEKSLIVGEARLIPDPRTNRILIITRPVNIPYLRDLIEQFDQALTLTQPLVYPLRYVSVSSILGVIKDIITEDLGESTGSAGAGGGAPAPRPAVAAAPRNLGTGPTGGGSLDRADALSDPQQDDSPESIIVGKTRIIADKRANAILVMGPPESRDKIATILQKLDQRPRQVYLSTMIGQLTIGDGQEFGVDLLQRYAGFHSKGFSSGQVTTGGTLQPARQLATLSNLLPGLNIYGVIGTTLDAYVRLLQSTNRFRVVSRPSVYAANNRKAVISSGQKIAIPTSTLSNLTGVNNNAAVTSNIQYQDVVLKLEVIPLINNDREVTLDIAQVNDSITGNQTVAGNTIPIIGTQQIRTYITVPNRTPIVLGGLITEENARNTQGVPVLSDIPVLGYLFRNTQKNARRSELLIFIQPIVVNSPAENLYASREEAERQAISDATLRMNQEQRPTDEVIKRAIEVDPRHPESIRRREQWRNIF
jgi:general secretion pathway protein D